MILVFMGPQGSGKGTQADLLAEKTGLFHLSTGAALREEARKETPFARKINQTINEGKLVSDEVIVRVLEKQLTPARLKKGVILDGTPRRENQALLLEKMLAQKNLQIDRVFLIDISQKETLRRLSGRVVCSRCGRNFNLLTNPPLKKGVCDFCQGQLKTRDDENEKAIKKRLSLYRQETLPLINRYLKKGILEKVDGQRSIKVIAADILARLKEQGLVK